MQILEWCELHKIGLIIAAIAVALLILIIGIIIRVHRHKKRSAKGKLYKTNDGFFTNRPDITKQRHVAAIAQRKIDGAIAVVKLYKLNGKEEKIGKNYISNLILLPEEHSSLTEPSIVGRQVLIGIKDGDKFKPIFVSDLINTGDELTDKELKKVLKEVNNYKPEHRKTHKKTMKSWRNGFKKKKQ